MSLLCYHCLIFIGFCLTQFHTLKFTTKIFLSRRMLNQFTQKFHWYLIYVNNLNKWHVLTTTNFHYQIYIIVIHIERIFIQTICIQCDSNKLILSKHLHNVYNSFDVYNSKIKRSYNRCQQIHFKGNFQRKQSEHQINFSARGNRYEDTPISSSM